MPSRESSRSMVLMVTCFGSTVDRSRLVQDSQHLGLVAANEAWPPSVARGPTSASVTWPRARSVTLLPLVPEPLSVARLVGKRVHWQAARLAFWAAPCSVFA